MAMFVLTDSSVICQYLEDKYPTPSLYPADIVKRAQARWLEEFADNRMGKFYLAFVQSGRDQACVG